MIQGVNKASFFRHLIIEDERRDYKNRLKLPHENHVSRF